MKQNGPSWRTDKRTSAQRGYGAAWQRARAAFLRRNALCCYCQAEGRITLATVVDHKVPHRGDERLFWDAGNWQAMCKAHHDGAKQAEERSGKKRRVVGPDGWPIESE